MLCYSTTPSWQVNDVISKTVKLVWSFDGPSSNTKETVQLLMWFIKLVNPHFTVM